MVVYTFLFGHDFLIWFNKCAKFTEHTVSCDNSDVHFLCPNHFWPSSQNFGDSWTLCVRFSRCMKLIGRLKRRAKVLKCSGNLKVWSYAKIQKN